MSRPPPLGPIQVCCVEGCPARQGFGYGGTGKKSFAKQFDDYGVQFKRRASLELKGSPPSRGQPEDCSQSFAFSVYPLPKHKPSKENQWGAFIWQPNMKPSYWRASGTRLEKFRNFMYF